MKLALQTKQPFQQTQQTAYIDKTAFSTNPTNCIYTEESFIENLILLGVDIKL